MRKVVHRVHIVVTKAAGQLEVLHLDQGGIPQAFGFGFYELVPRGRPHSYEIVRLHGLAMPNFL